MPSPASASPSTIWLHSPRVGTAAAGGAMAMLVIVEVPVLVVVAQVADMVLW